MSENVLSSVPCEIISIKEENAHEYTFRIDTDITASHGQFLQINVPKFGEAPISVSGMGYGYLDFTIRAVGKVTEELFRLHAGDTIYLRGPYGVGWPFDKFQGKNLVIIAGGTGVAPIKTMVDAICKDKSYVASLNLLFGYRDENCILFRDDLAKWKTEFNTTYTLDNGIVDGFEQGMVTKHLDKVFKPEFGDKYEVIVVGPPAMMHFTCLDLVKMGIPEQKIWTSFERKMSCAVGKCGHCRINEVYVCSEGPVFNYTVAKDLLD